MNFYFALLENSTFFFVVSNVFSLGSLPIILAKSTASFFNNFFFSIGSSIPYQNNLMDLFIFVFFINIGESYLNSFSPQTSCNMNPWHKKFQVCWFNFESWWLKDQVFFAIIVSVYYEFDFKTVFRNAFFY